MTRPAAKVAPPAQRVPPSSDGTRAETSDLIEEILEELRVSLEELKVAEEAIKERTHALSDVQKRYERLFRIAPLALVTTDLHGMIREANTAAVELLGEPRSSLVDKPLAMYIEGTERKAFNAEVQRLFTWLEPRNLKTSIVTPTRRFPAALTVSVDRDGKGNPRDLLWLLQERAG